MVELAVPKTKYKEVVQYLNYHELDFRPVAEVGCVFYYYKLFLSVLSPKHKESLGKLGCYSYHQMKLEKLTCKSSSPTQTSNDQSSASIPVDSETKSTENA